MIHHHSSKSVSPDVLGLIVGSLAGGVDGGVGDAAAGDTQGLDHAALRLLHTLDGLGVDGDVARLGACEAHLIIMDEDY